MNILLVTNLRQVSQDRDKCPGFATLRHGSATRIDATLVADPQHLSLISRPPVANVRHLPPIHSDTHFGSADWRQVSQMSDKCRGCVRMWDKCRGDWRQVSRIGDKCRGLRTSVRMVKPCCSVLTPLTLCTTLLLTVFCSITLHFVKLFCSLWNHLNLCETLSLVLKASCSL